MVTQRTIWGILKNLFDNNVVEMAGSGAPTDGTSGTGVPLRAGKGSTYVDIATGNIYVNLGTAASPTWTLYPTGAALSVTSAMLAAGSVTSSKLDASTVQIATGSIVPADIIGTSAGQLGHVNGVVMVPSGGAHVVTELISCIAIMDFIVAAYTLGGNTGVKISGGGAALTGVVANTVFIQASADIIQHFVPLAVTPLTPTENTGLNLVTSAAPTNPGTAAGIIRWKCAYRQYATGL